MEVICDSNLDYWLLSNNAINCKNRDDDCRDCCECKDSDCQDNKCDCSCDSNCGKDGG